MGLNVYYFFCYYCIIYTAVLCFEFHQNFVFGSDMSRFTQNNEFLRDVMLCLSVIPDLDHEHEGSVFRWIVLDVAKDCDVGNSWANDAACHLNWLLISSSGAVAAPNLASFIAWREIMARSQNNLRTCYEHFNFNFNLFLFIWSDRGFWPTGYRTSQINITL